MNAKVAHLEIKGLNLNVSNTKAGQGVEIVTHVFPNVDANDGRMTLTAR